MLGPGEMPQSAAVIYRDGLMLSCFFMRPPQRLGSSIPPRR